MKFTYASILVASACVVVVGPLSHMNFPHAAPVPEITIVAVSGMPLGSLFDALRPSPIHDRILRLGRAGLGSRPNTCSRNRMHAICLPKWTADRRRRAGTTADVNPGDEPGDGSVVLFCAEPIVE